MSFDIILLFEFTFSAVMEKYKVAIFNKRKEEKERDDVKKHITTEICI